VPYTSESTNNKIEVFLSRFGKIKSFFLVSGRGKHNLHKGYGFVEFVDLKDTRKSLLESGKHKLDNKRIRFNFTKGGSSTDIKTKMNCWFCLDNPESDKSLVVHETPEAYLALDKGPIDKFHFLLIPQAHVKNQRDLSAVEHSAITTLETQLQEFFRAERKAYVKYEQYFRLAEGVSHMLTHYISLPVEKFGTL
jgi:diadenosine tetraphosphate (Ap4A) HIT family hydrolase